jgi:hypothetical protein
MPDDGDQISDYAGQDENAAETQEEQKARWVRPKESDPLDD